MQPSAELEAGRILEGGESLIWAGAPGQGVRLRGTDAMMIPFSMLWGGFAIFWESSVLHSGAPWFFALWGVPFVGIGLYMIVGRFFVDARMRARTIYVLTDRRVVIVSGLLSRTINSLPLRTLQDVSVTEGSDGTGTVMFGRPNPYASRGSGMRWPGMSQYQPPSFELIASARRVCDQVLQAQRAAR